MPSVVASSYEYQERKKCVEKMERILEGLPEYVSRFLYSKLNGIRSLQPRTVLAYAGDINLFFYFLSECRHMSPKEITTDYLGELISDDIDDFYIWTGEYTKGEKTYHNNSAAQKRKIASISALYHYLMQKHFVNSNPCLLLDKARIQDKPIIALSDRQQKKLIENIGKASIKKDGCVSHRSEVIKENYTSIRDTAITYVFLGTGMRVSELVAINIDDMNLEDRYFIITRKGGKHQAIYFGDEVADVLHLYLRESRPKLVPKEKSEDATALFLSLHHRRLGVRQVENIIKDAAKRALGEAEAKDISCHKLRSTYGTRLLKGSNSIALVAEVLGHRDISTTKRRYSAVQNLEQAPSFVSVDPYAN